MDIIIVGCGKIGCILTQQLCKEGHNVSVIDIDKDAVEQASVKFDVLGVIGNGVSSHVQEDAGIDSAQLVIAVTGSDEVNMLCCLVAKKTGNCHTIARIQNLVYSEEIRILKDELGLSMTINSEYAAALEITRLLRFPSAIKIETFVKGRVEILRYKLPGNSRLHNCSLFEITDRLKCDVLVCAVERQDEVIIPNGNFVLKEGDFISVVATPKKAVEFFKKIGVGTSRVKSTMLVGGGGITYYAAKELLNMGVDVTIIEKKRERCRLLSEALPQAMIIHGDGIDQNLLVEEGLDSVDSFGALTNMDEENILLSLYVKSKTNAKLITKVNKITFDDVIHSLDLGSVICPKNIVSENVIQYVRAMQNSVGSNVETLYNFIEDKAEALEFIVREESQVTGVPLERLSLKDNIIIACINHKGRITIPKGRDMILKGDSVIVVTTNSGLDDITDILRGN